MFLIVAIIAAPLLAVAWWLGSPLFLDDEVSEDFPLAGGGLVPDDMTEDEVESEMQKAADAPDTQATDPMPDEGAPVAVASGDFIDFDEFHHGSGTATIYRLEDGSHVLRLESLEVTNGPDLHVLLVPAPNPASRDEISGYVDLGSLKGNVGDQNYDIADDVDIGVFGSVVVYCQPFHVIFSVATLR
jgi:hypothetical protein